MTIHGEIIQEDEGAEPGVRDADQIEFVITYISEGHFGEMPETIHEKAFHLMRLLAANHWFVDGNKRTALYTTNLFYLFNGYELQYGDDLRAMLKMFSVRQDILDEEVGIEYVSERTGPRDPITDSHLGIIPLLEVFESVGEALSDPEE